MTPKPKPPRKTPRNRVPPVEIREMKLDDLPAVFDLGQRLFTASELPTLYRCWDDHEIMELFSASANTCLVAEAKEPDRIVGFVLGRTMEKPRNAWRYGWLEWLGVDPGCKRGGIASRLVNQLTERFVQQDARIMLVDTDEGNDGALAFFRKNGFGQDLRHVYLSRNLDGHPANREKKNGAS